MKKRVCKFQDTMFAENLGILISRCMNKDCNNFTVSLSEEICEKCVDRTQPEKEPHLETVLAMEVENLRPQEIIDHNYDTHCEACENRIGEYFCKNLHFLPIRELMKLPNIQCPLELW